MMTTLGLSCCCTGAADGVAVHAIVVTQIAKMQNARTLLCWLNIADLLNGYATVLGPNEHRGPVSAGDVDGISTSRSANSAS
jgi:hypothetical protein